MTFAWRPAIITYDWKKILRRAGHSSTEIVKAFAAHASTRLPKNKLDPIYPYYYMDFEGESFMLNPHQLLRNPLRYPNKMLAQYIALASYRNFANYLVTNDASLDLLHSPVSQDIINKNRLLRIHNDRIYFYYEEAAERRNKLWH